MYKENLANDKANDKILDDMDKEKNFNKSIKSDNPILSDKINNPTNLLSSETQRIFTNLNDKSSYFVYKSYGDLAIPIIYEDNHIIAAVKPAGVLSQADSSTKPDMLTILKSYIKEKYNKQGDVFVGLVHRLDCPVSGVMVFARTSKGASRISEQIRGKAVTKKYYAVVQGVPMQRQGRLVDFIAKGKNNTAEHSDDGKESSLLYDTLALDDAKKSSLLEIVLETGRTHQIRFQLANIGNPIMGERKYAANEEVKRVCMERSDLLQNRNSAKTADYKDNQIFKNSGGPDKSENDIALFSFHFAFKHPTRDINLQIEAVPLYNGYWKMFEEYFNNM